MKKIVKKAVSVMMGIVMSLSGVCAAAQTEADGVEKVAVWRRIDVVLHSDKKYGNPYKDVDIDAVFTHEDGTEIKLYGFWNGGDEWRVRFAPTKTGVWNYNIVCTDKENGSLSRSGSLLAVENNGETGTDRHGFIKISDNGRYFTYDDGTPFFWLGDTNWQAPNYVSINRCNYPGCKCGNQFTHEVNDRIKKGFTVYQTYFDSSESDGGGQIPVTPEPSMWTKKYELIDPKVFTEKYDYMFDYLADSGMVIALGFGVHSITTKSMKKDALDRLSRYLTARYAAYPVVWITAQEVTGKEHFDLWMSSARITDAGDGYNHPQSAHMFPLDVNDERVRELASEDWHDWFALQNGHGPTIPAKATYNGYYKYTYTVNGEKKNKPFVETEANYEDIYCGGFNGYKASRIAAWKANLCGSCGFTYGVTGIWANCWSTAGSTGWLGTFSTEPWYMGLDKPGSYEMKYMAEFFKTVGFHRLVPRFDARSHSDFSAETKVLASTDDGKTAVMYFYNSDKTTGTLKKLNENETYSARWFDPLTGNYIKAADGVKTSGSYVLPEKPDTGDWVLLVTSEDFGAFATEPAPETDGAETEKINVLKGASGECSTSTGGHEAAKATDGSSDTYWCASSEDFPQWVSYDMKEAKTFRTVRFSMHAGTMNASYVIEGSDDNKNWKKLYETQNAGASGEYIRADLPEAETCRYIRITFDSVVGNWATIHEAEAYASAAGTPAVKEFAGEIQKPDAVCIGSCVYDAAGRLSDSTGDLFDGNQKTIWRPFAAESTQTVRMDLREKKALTGINVVLGPKSCVPAVRVDASNDGEVWYVVKDTSKTETVPCKGEKYGTKNVISLELKGDYRYVNLIIMGGPGKDVVKSVSEIELFADAAESQSADTETAAETGETTVTETETEVTAGVDDAGEKGGFPFVPVIAAAAAAAAAVVTGAVLIAKKKKKK